MNIDELQALREEILADVTPLVVDDSPNGPDKFALLLRLIQSGRASGDVYKKAYASAKEIQDTGERLDALMSLLDEIDVDIDQQTDSEEPEPANGTPTQEAAQAMNAGPDDQQQ